MQNYPIPLARKLGGFSSCIWLQAAYPQQLEQ